MSNSSDGFNSEPSPDEAEAFYNGLFDDQQLGRNGGALVTGFEVDFLQDQTRWFPYMVQQHDGAAKSVE